MRLGPCPKANPKLKLGPRTAGPNLGAGTVDAPVSNQLTPCIQRAGRLLLGGDEGVELGDQQALARAQVLRRQAVRARLSLKVLDEPAALRGAACGFSGHTLCQEGGCRFSLKTQKNLCGCALSHVSACCWAGPWPCPCYICL